MSVEQGGQVNELSLPIHLPEISHTDMTVNPSEWNCYLAAE
jgi:hypothetical protein